MGEILGDHPELAVLGIAILAMAAGISWLGDQRAILLPVLIATSVIAALLTFAAVWRRRRHREKGKPTQS